MISNHYNNTIIIGAGQSDLTCFDRLSTPPNPLPLRAHFLKERERLRHD